MEILLIIREYFGYLAISPTKKRFNLQHIFTLVLFLQFAFALLAFFLFTATRLEEYVDCFYALVTAPLNVMTFSSNVWKSPIIFKMINDVETTVQKRCENPTAKTVYEKANENSNKLTKYIYTALVRITIPSIFLISFFGSFFFYFTTDLGESSFRLPFPVEYPFSLKTPIGYTVAFVVTFAAFYIIGQSCTCILGLLIGMCSMITTFILDLKEDLNHLDGNMQNVCEFVKLHSRAKQLSDNLRFAEDLKYIYQLIITGYYIWSLLTICDNLLSAQVEMVRNPGSPVIWISLTKVFWSFVQVFFFCYFGEQLNSGFSDLNEELYKCDWYLLPVQLQKLFPIIIMNSRQPVYLEGFGNVRCTLETFKKIANGGFSYFMILRQMEY